MGCRGLLERTRGVLEPGSAVGYSVYLNLTFGLHSDGPDGWHSSMQGGEEQVEMGLDASHSYAGSLGGVVACDGQLQYVVATRNGRTTRTGVSSSCCLAPVVLVDWIRS